MKNREIYLAPLRFDWLTEIYDPVVRWTMREQTFKSELVRQANIATGQRVLDVGCGTGTLALMVKRRYPGARVTGLDGDDRALAHAHRKMRRFGLKLDLQKGLAQRMPFNAQIFHRVISSLFFHHLTTPAKREALVEIYRVLKAGGELHVADFGKAQNLAMRGSFFLVQLLDGFAPTSDNVRGRLPEFMCAAGFSNVRETRRFATAFGTVSLYSAMKM